MAQGNRLSFVKGQVWGKGGMRSGFRGGGDREEKGPGLEDGGGEKHVSGKELFFLFTECITWGSLCGVWEPLTAADIRGEVKGQGRSGWLPEALGIEAGHKVASSRKHGRRAAQGPKSGGDAEPGLPSQPCLRALVGVGGRVSRGS